LSFIFLISPESSILSKISPSDKIAVLKSLDIRSNIKPLKESILLLHLEIKEVLDVDYIEEDERYSCIDRLRNTYKEPED
jgi:hypothetical protein